MLPNFVDCADVGMIESRSGPGFAPEAFECLRVSRQILRQKLQRDMTAEAEVFGFIHHAHAPTTELLQDAVVGYRVAKY